MIMNILKGFFVPAFSYVTLKTILFFAFPDIIDLTYLKITTLANTTARSAVILVFVLLVQALIICFLFRKTQNSFPCIRYIGKAISFTAVMTVIMGFENVVFILASSEPATKPVFKYLLFEILPLLVTALCLAKIYTPVARSASK